MSAKNQSMDMSERWLRIKNIFQRCPVALIIDPLAQANIIIGTTDSDQIFGRDLNDTIKGLRGDDLLLGEAGDDRIEGGAGDDVINGGPGNDIAKAGKGNDIIIGDRGDDIIDGGSGSVDVADYSSLGAPITLLDMGQIFKLDFGTDILLSIETVIGDATQLNTIDGISDGAFFDNDNNASFNINLSAESLTVDIASSGIGPFDIRVVNFNNVIGTNLDDVIQGNAFANDLSGERGDDVLQGGKGHDILTGGLGSDRLFGGNGKDTLWGNRGSDSLVGGNGDDVLQGGQGKDIIDGSGSKLGANDFDQFFGGSNSDLFVLGNTQEKLYLGDGFAAILDFKSGTDKIQLNGSAEEYVFVSDSIILLDGDLIATTNSAFDLQSDFVFVDPLSGAVAVW